MGAGMLPHPREQRRLHGQVSTKKKIRFAKEAPKPDKVTPTAGYFFQKGDVDISSLANNRKS